MSSFLILSAKYGRGNSSSFVTAKEFTLIKNSFILDHMKTFFKELKDFVVNTANDERIPERDKKVILAMLALILSPVDFIPDWIPFFGVIDDFILLALVLDYFFSTLDQSIILSHFPWDMKSYSRIRRMVGMTSAMVPGFIKNNLWKYTREPY